MITDLRSSNKKDICVQTSLTATFGGFVDCCEQLNDYSTVIKACWYGPSTTPGGVDYCQITRPWAGGTTIEMARWTNTGEALGTMAPGDVSDCPVIGTPQVDFGGRGIRIVSYCVEDPDDPIFHRSYAYWDIYVSMSLPCAQSGSDPVCCTIYSGPHPSGLRGCWAYAGCALIPLEAMCGHVGDALTVMLECVEGTDPALCTMELEISNDGGAVCP